MQSNIEDPFLVLLSAKELNEIGNNHQKGIGVPKDIQKAIYYYKKAIEKNSSAAMNNLAFLYQHGEGLPQDYALAMDYYQMAAALDEPVAISNLGCMHYLGQGTPVCYETAVIHFRRSWALSCKAAKECLIKMQERLPENTLVQYHCTMALCPKDLYLLFKQSTQELTDIIGNDEFLTDQDKENLLERLYEKLLEPEPIVSEKTAKSLTQSPSFFCIGDLYALSDIGQGSSPKLGQ